VSQAGRSNTTRRWIRWPLYGIAGMLGLALLVTLAMRWMIARAPQYQTAIKSWVHEQTGFYIRFAKLDAQLRWDGPELYFDRIELRSKDDAKVLVAARSASVGVDLWGIIRNGNLLTARVRIDSPQIDVVRKGPRSFLLASQIELFPQVNPASHLNLNALPGGYLHIRNADITLHDWNPDLTTLRLAAANITVERRGDALDLDLRTAMPDPLAGKLRVAVQAHELGDERTTRWEAHVYARDFSLPGWHRLLPDFSNAVAAGVASFDLLADGRGSELALANLDFGAYQVQVPALNDAVTRFDELSGRMAMHHAGDWWSLTVQRLQALQPGRRDPPMQLGANWRLRDGRITEFSARANALDADRLAPASALLPDAQMRDRIAALGIAGKWSDPFFQYQAAGGGAARWRVKATFTDAGFAAVGNKAGLSGLSGSVAGNERGGLLQLHSNDARFDWPSEFPQTVSLNKLNASIAWERTVDGFLAASADAELQNPDAAARSKFSYRIFDDGSPAQIVLAADILNGNVAAARKYLPRQHIAPKGLAWLNRAFIAGHAPSGQLVLRGPLKHFPFRDGSGLFLARFPLNDLIMDYHDGWPRFEHVNVDTEFRNAGLRVTIRHGKIGALEVDGGEGVFEDFKTGELRVKAHARGDTQAALDFLRATPIDGLVEKAFSTVQGNGPMDADVDLFLPFKAFDQRRILVNGHLNQIALSHPTSRLSATEVSGDFTVEGAQVTHADVHGRAFGGPFQLSTRDARAHSDKGTQLEVRGTAAVDSLVANYNLPAAWFGGTHIDWRTVVRVFPEPSRERSVRVTSSLQGLEVRLPAPLGKPADRSMPASVDLDWPKNAGLQVRFGLGATLRGIANLSADAGARRIDKASVVFGGGAPAFSGTGLYVSGRIAALDLGAWLKVRDGLDSTGGASNRVPALNLREAKLEFGELDLRGLVFRDLGIAVQPTESAWSIDISSDLSAGHISIPNAAGVWEIRMQRLNIPDREDSARQDSHRDGAEAIEGEAATTAAPADPHAVPSVDLKIQQLTWGDRTVGSVDARLVRSAGGVELTHLDVQGSSFQFDATGSWLGLGQGQTRFGGTLSSSSIEETLQTFAMADVIRAKSGRIEFDLNGLGPPSARLLAGLNGRIKIDLSGGELVGVKPGAGRLLGLASLASLRRRLALDFSDLTDQGLAFDTAHSSFDLRNGDAFTEDTLLKGPAAEIGMIGRVGLAKRDYDQTAVVTGKLGASFPVVASTLAGGPVLGAAVLLFTQVFKQPLKGLARGYYRITGSWDNPSVERVKSGEAAAAQRQSEGSK
jgi:uncharacterized protein (TIGR02099 family)